MWDGNMIKGEMPDQLSNLKMPTIPLPLDPDEKAASKGEIHFWEKTIDWVAKQQTLLEENNKSFFPTMGAM